MSQTYTDIDLINFPNNTDNCFIMVDPSAADMDVINMYNACIASGDMTGAVQVLENNALLSVFSNMV